MSERGAVHSVHHSIPTGLIPKDYRSLKTQYLQVREPGAPGLSEQGLSSLPAPALLSYLKQPAGLLRVPEAVSHCCLA